MGEAKAREALAMLAQRKEQRRASARLRRKARLATLAEDSDEAMIAVRACPSLGD